MMLKKRGLATVLVLIILLSFSGVTEEDDGSTQEDQPKNKRKKKKYKKKNHSARKKCINHYGCTCFVCNFDFEAEYGALGRSFIHAHHLIELSTIRAEYTVDPIKDLRPLCPNCHAMIHRKRPALSIDELRGHLTARSKGRA